jgi:hypothetical protein
MTASAIEICYLCAQTIKSKSDSNLDHVFSQLFINRSQPKAKGFTYGGTLPTHRTCNSLFGNNPEADCRDALQNIQDLMAATDRGHRMDDWSHAVNSSGKIESEYSEPLNTALSVLAKNAAAVLMRFYGIAPDTHWRIINLSNVYGPDAKKVFDGLMDDKNPIESEMYFHPKQLPDGNFFIGFSREQLGVLFYFEFNPNVKTLKEIRDELTPWPQFLFESNQLIDLVGYDWCGAKL